MAVHHHPTTHEPYLQLPLQPVPPNGSSSSSPPLNLRLTAPRPSDASAVIAALNDPRVYMNALSPPFPFLFHHWQAWFGAIDGKARAARADLAAVERGEKRWVGTGLAFPAIREVVVRGEGDEGDGEEEEVFLGKVEIRRADYRTVADGAEREAARRANARLEAGDPRIEWEVGFWLCPEAHRRGIMTTVLRTLLDTFFVDYMNVHSLKGSCLSHNKASKRVLEKCGFVFENEEPDVFEVAESKTGVKGQRVGAIHMRWRAA